MPKFLTIGYGDRTGYERCDAAATAAAHDHDDRLRAQGVVMGVAGAPTQVRNPEGTGVTTSDGPFLSADLPVAGFALIEAPTLAQAIDMASRTPCAVAHGVVEVWPLEQPG
jgi:hypothetical protein